MKVKIVLLVSILVSSITMLGISKIASATPSNWSEVVRFTGSTSEHYTTDYFTCNHVEWRIRWEYVPDPSYSNFARFVVFTYPQGEDTLFIDSVYKAGASDTEGISYIHNNKGTFYMEINVLYTQSYTIIVEQDLDSILEFPSFIILPVFMMITVLAVIVYRRKMRNAEKL